MKKVIISSLCAIPFALATIGNAYAQDAGTVNDDSAPETAPANKETLKGNWNELKGKAKEKWGKLTDDDIKVIEGQRDQLIGKLQQREGLAKAQAEKEVREWEQENDAQWSRK